MATRNPESTPSNPGRGIFWAAIISLACWALFIGVVASLAGCAGPNATFDEKQRSVSGAMDALAAARFKGEIDMTMGGSPLGLNASTNWSLGPAQSTLHVRGEVDFSQAARPATP